MEEFELTQAISLSIQEIKPLHFKYLLHPLTASTSYDEQLALLIDSNLNSASAVHNKTRIICTYSNRSNAQKCKICDAILQ
jgi:hypothetical protein